MEPLPSTEELAIFQISIVCFLLAMCVCSDDMRTRATSRLQECQNGWCSPVCKADYESLAIPRIKGELLHSCVKYLPRYVH